MGAALALGLEFRLVLCFERRETCRFPGCSRSARRSEIDHTVDWQFGSDTAHLNLAYLCLAHHHFKHQTAWPYTQDAHGRLE